MLQINLVTAEVATQNKRLSRNEYMARFTERRRNEVLSLLGWKCQSSDCLVPGGCKDARALQIDHVHNDGSTDMTRNNPMALRRKVLADKDGRYQLLCANCNVTKEYERRKLEGRSTVAKGMH